MTLVGVLEKDQVVFPRLGLEFSISDTAFTLFGMEIKWYGILIALGMLLAMTYGFSQMKKYGVDPDRAMDAVIGGVLGGLVGARIYYVVMSWDSYAGDWKAIFNLRNGGLAIYGGLIGAILVGGLVAKFRKVRLLPLFDVCGIGFLLGQGIGRWGNFTNQEAFGCNTRSLFGMSSGRIQQWIMNHGDTATLASGDVMEVSQPVHPCFLYESVWCLLGFILLAIFAKKIRKYDGQIFLIYIAWYGLGRFFIEGLRTDSLMIGSLRVSQGLAAVCVIVSVILQIVIGLKVKRIGSDYQLYVNTEESKRLIKESEEKRNRSKGESEVTDNKSEINDSEIEVKDNESDIIGEESEARENEGQEKDNSNTNIEENQEEE